ncbi:MAG: histidine phosphatase family protein [Pseudomonadota bacterium]
MASLLFISHPKVIVDPHRDVTRWGLSEKGRDRARRFAESATLSQVTAIWSSEEVKAMETATCLAAAHSLPVKTDGRLGENDRSATGFLDPVAFEAAADRFFAQPARSFRGWERAVDAQDRIHRAVKDITGAHQGGDIAVVSHGAVGTLLYSALMGLPISREYDQPGQGHYWAAALSDMVPRHWWLPLV